MANKKTVSANSQLVRLNVNGLRGRMLYLPEKNSSNHFLLIYDALSVLENWAYYIESLNNYGSVSCIDLPGFGGMESFYRINERPTLDMFADYLAAIVKLRFRGKRITIVGIGFGFVIATRMLQKYPEIQRKTKLIISIGGYARYDDFNIDAYKRKAYLTTFYLSRYLIASFFAKMLVYNNLSMRFWYRYKQFDDFYDQLNQSNKELYLATRLNQLKKTNLRTYLSYKYEVLRLDNCNKQLNVPLWHISLSANTNGKVTEQHLQVIYKTFQQAKVNLDNKILIMQNRKIAGRLLPPKLRVLLSRLR